jgi:hypothetical protein
MTVKSIIESKQLGLSVGRLNTDCVILEPLKEGILTNGYDVVRVKTTASDTMISAKLNELGYPVYFAGGIRKYHVNINEFPIAPYRNPELCFECYDGSQYEILREILLDTWLQYPIGYFRTPGLSHLISREAEIECVIQYYHENNNQTIKPNNSLWFLKLGTQHVGFLALNILDQDNIESNIAGIARSFQGKGLFHDVLRFIRNYGKDRGITNFYCGARNENLNSQRTFESEYMTGVNTEYVFHVVSMLSNQGKDLGRGRLKGV